MRPVDLGEEGMIFDFLDSICAKPFGVGPAEKRDEKRANFLR